MSGGLYRSANATPPGIQPPVDGAIFISADPLNQPAVESTAPPTEQVAEGSAAANSAVMAIISVVSRGIGFVRNLMITAALGTAAIGDAYTSALFIPQTVYELLLGGILSSVLVPVLVRRRHVDSDRGEAYAQRLLSLAVLTLGVATLLAVLAAPLLTWIYAGGRGEAYGDLVTALSRLLLPILFFSGLSALITAVLNTRGHFAAPMWSPILNNLVIIATAGLYIALYGTRIVQPEQMSVGQILLVGGGTLLGIAAQATGLLMALRKVDFRWRWRFDFRALGLGELGRLGGWMFCYVGVNSIGFIVLLNLLNRVDDKSAGAIIYNNVFLLLMTAHGIIAVSIITALMPRMSAAAAAGRYQDLAADLTQGIRTVTAVLAPIAVCYAVLAEPIAFALFNYGAAQGRSGTITPVLLVASLALVPFAISQLCTFAFYALADTRTPALINIPVVVLRLFLQVGVSFALSTSFLAAGMMIGNGVSYLVAAVISAWLLRARIGRLGLTATVRNFSKVLAAALGAALVGLLVVRLLPDTANGNQVLAVIVVLVGGAVIGGTYVALAMALRIREITEVMRLVWRKLGR